MYGYSPEVVRFSYQSTLDYYAALGIELSQADREQLAADTIDHFIGLGLIENKLRETGQDIITEEQAQSLRTHAQNLYESVWQGLYQELTASGGKGQRSAGEPVAGETGLHRGRLLSGSAGLRAVPPHPGPLLRRCNRHPSSDFAVLSGRLCQSGPAAL